MRGTRSADPLVTVEAFGSLAALPADAAGLFAGSGSLFASLLWWDVVAAHAMPAGSHPCFMLCRLGGRPAGLFPLRQAGPVLASLTTPYSCLYTPALAAGLSEADTCAVFRAFARVCRRHGRVQLEALPADWPHLPALIGAARSRKIVPLQYDHFGNWYEAVGGMGWSGYLAHRPGALRETIRRRLRRASALADATFQLVSGTDGVDAAIVRYESVYARSWKTAEPFPAFNAALMRATAQSGQLRLGTWSIGDVPVAAQFWVVEGSRATVLKLAHDEAFKAHSPGTVLTALMLRHLLDLEAITEIDFGRGDDAYKQGWAAARRQRIGLVLATPWRPAGMLAILRHGVGRLRARARRTAAAQQAKTAETGAQHEQ